MAECSEGTTEFRDDLFCRSDCGSVGLTGYSARFRPKNPLILPIACLFSIEGVNYDLRIFSLVSLSLLVV